MTGVARNRRTFSIVVAMSSLNGIGKNGELPWNIREDMAYFRRITTGEASKRNACIMGRTTWESIPERFRPLKARENIVLSRSQTRPSSIPEHVHVSGSLEATLEGLEGRDDIHEIFVIGGASVYKQAITMEECTKLFITHVQGEFGCDVHFPQVPPQFVLDEKAGTPGAGSETSSEGIKFDFCVYNKAP